MKNRRNKKSKKEIIKRAFIKGVANLIYYSLYGILGVAVILLFFGTIGAVVELCEHSKLYCLCYFIVCGYIITRFIIKEMLSNE